MPGNGKVSCLFITSYKQFQRTRSNICIFSWWWIGAPSLVNWSGCFCSPSFRWGDVWELHWTNVSSCVAFQWCGTEITDYFLLHFFCTVSRVILTAILNFFYHSVFIMCIVEIADKFRHTWLMTVTDTCFQKQPLEIKSFYMVKETLISWGGWWKSSFMALQFNSANISTNIFVYRCLFQNEEFLLPDVPKQ